MQNDDKYIAFNKHVAAELIKQEVLSTNLELAHELKTHVELCAARKQGPKGSALLSIIASYFETDISRNAALDQMHLLSIQLQGKSIKDLLRVRAEDQLRLAWPERFRQAGRSHHVPVAMEAGEACADPDPHHRQGPRTEEL